MILLLFIICIVNLITFYNVDYKYYKEHIIAKFICTDCKIQMCIFS